MKKNPSLFFPLSLIAAGALWLLVQMKYIPLQNLWALAYIWPYVLIALGLGLILRSVWHESVGMFVSALVVAGAVLAVIYAPQLGWADAPAHWSVSDGFSGGVEGSGKIKTETRKVTGFDAISIRYPADVLIVQGKDESVKLEADDNLLPQLSAEISGRELVIQSSEDNWAKQVNPSHIVKITITVNDLREVEFPTAGKLRVEGLKSDSLKILLSGAGDVQLVRLDVGSLECVLSGAGSLSADGVSEQTKIQIDGFGDFNGAELESGSAEVAINGAGSITLKVKTSLVATINGAGSVGYYGSPTVKKTINGAGSVNPLGQ